EQPPQSLEPHVACGDDLGVPGIHGSHVPGSRPVDGSRGGLEANHAAWLECGDLNPERVAALPFAHLSFRSQADPHRSLVERMHTLHAHPLGPGGDLGQVCEDLRYRSRDRCAGAIARHRWPSSMLESPPWTCRLADTQN